jgi:hypothetical protein
MSPTSTHNASTAGAVDRLVAGFALGAIVVHDLAHVREGRAHDLFWVCNVAAILPGIALLVRSRLLATVALTWLLPGTAVWLGDVALGSATILPTSWGIHVGGALASVWAVARLGRSRAAFFAAIALVAVCFALSAWVLPPDTNVNAARHVPEGWTFLGASRTGFLAVAAAIVIAAAAMGQLLAASLERGARALTR